RDPAISAPGSATVGTRERSPGVGAVADHALPARCQPVDALAADRTAVGPGSALRPAAQRRRVPRPGRPGADLGEHRCRVGPARRGRPAAIAQAAAHLLVAAGDAPHSAALATD